MKKVFRLSVVLLFIFILNLPALAALDINGQVFFDMYYYHQDKEGFARPYYWTAAGMKTQPGSGGVAGIPVGQRSSADDRYQTYFDLNHASSLRFHWTNEEGLGAFTVLYMNAEPYQSQGTDPGFHVGVSIVNLYYDVTKNLRITAGKGGATEIFSPYNPYTTMGYDSICKVELLGYGNINSKYANNLRFTYKFNPMVALDFGLFNPKLLADTELMGGPGFVAKTGTSIDNDSKIPKIEVSVPLNFTGDWGQVSVTPSAMYLKQQFGNVSSGDDSVTSYGLSLGGKAALFGFTLMGEYNYGQNLYSASRVGEAQVYPFKYEYITGGIRNAMGARAYAGQVYDAKTNAFWIQLGYTILGRVTPTLYYGRENTNRDMPTGPSPSPSTGIDPYGDTSVTTQAYGISIPIKVTKLLTVVPEYMIYDNGNSNKINGTTYDFGKEWVAGVQFRLHF